MAQPTETDRRFEVSERSSALPVPALSRYARPRTETDAPPDEHARSKAPSVAADEAATTDRPRLEDVPLDEALTRIEDLLDSAPDAEREPADPRDSQPIVQAADEEWATDPSPPQPVQAGRRTDTPRTEAAEGRSLPALRDRAQRPPEPEREERRPFWKRLSMSRPAAQTPPPPAIPPDLLKPALERIDHLTRRFEREQKALHERLDQFEHNITRLWELEEQMGLEEVRAQLAVIQANQEEIADGVHALARNLAIAAGLGVTLIAALLLWMVL